MDRCPECQEFILTTPHRCAPAWECRFAKGGPIYVDEDQEWEKVHAHFNEAAAEKFCERYDWDGGEYAVLGLGEHNPPTVEVRKLGATEIKLIRVVGSSEPVYRGEEIEA